MFQKHQSRSLVGRHSVFWFYHLFVYYTVSYGSKISLTLEMFPYDTHMAFILHVIGVLPFWHISNKPHIAIISGIC